MPTFDAGSIEGSLDLDLTPFDQALDRALARADEFDGKKWSAKAGLDTGEFTTELDKIKAKLDEFKTKSASIKVTLDVNERPLLDLWALLDFMEAHVYVVRVRVDVTGREKIDTLIARLAALHDRDIDVRVNTSETGSSSGGFGGMQSIIMAILVLLPVLATGIMGIIGLLGTLGAAVTIAGVGFGALALVAIPALTEITKAMSATGKGINSLPPALQAAAKAYQGLTNEVHALQAAAGDKVGLMLAATFSTLTDILKSLQPVILAAADAFTALMGIADRFFKSSDWVNFSNFLRGNLMGVVVDLGNSIFSLIGALLNLTRAFWDFGGSEIMGMIVKGLQDFDQWTKTLAQNQGFIDFMHEVVLAFPPVMDFIGQLVVFLLHLTQALSPLGRLILDNILNPMLSFVNSLPPSVLGPVALGITAIVLAITGFGGPVSLAIIAIGAIALGLKNLYDNVPAVHEVIDKFASMIHDWFVPVWQHLVDLWNQYVVPAWDKLMARFSDPAVQGKLKEWGDLFVQKILPALEKLADDIVQFVIPALIDMLTFLAPFIGFLADLVARGYIEGISRALNVLAGALEVVSGIIEFFIDVLSGNWKKAWEDIGKILNGMGQEVAGALGITKQELDDWFKKLITDVTLWWKGLWGPDGTLATGIKDWAFNTFGAGNPAVKAISDWSNGISKTVNGTFDGVLTNITDFFKNAGKGVDDFFGPVGKFLSATKSWATDFGNTFETGLSNIEKGWQKRVDDFDKSPAHAFFTMIGDFVSAKWKEIFGTDGTVATTTNSWVIDTGSKFAAGTADVQQKVTDFLANVLSGWVGKFGPQGEVTTTTQQWGNQTNSDINNWLNTNVMDSFNRFWTEAKAGWDKAFGPVGDFLTATQQWGTQTGTDFQHYLHDVALPAANTFLTDLGIAWDKSFGANGGLLSGLKTFWDSAGRGFQLAWDGIKTATDIFVSALGTAWTRMENLFAGPVNWVINTVINAGLIDTFNTVMGWLGQPDRLNHVGTIGTGAVAGGAGAGGAAGFAAGGEIPMTPGAMRGKDSVLINAMPGEFMLSTSDVANLGGVAGVQALRQMAKGYAAGGPITAGASAGASPVAAGMPAANPGLSGIAGIVTSTLNALLSFSGIPGAGAPVSKPPEGMAIMLVAKTISTIVTKVEAAIAAAAAAAAAAFGPGGGPAPSGQISDWIAQALAILGYPSTYAAGIYQQIMLESSGNPGAIQGNIGDVNNASGDLAKGIMQVIGTTFASYSLPGHTDVFNPVDNIIAGSRYAMARYGAGWFAPGPQHSHGYDQGGILKPGMTMAINRTGAPERVLNADHTARLDALLTQGGAGPTSNADVVDKLSEVKDLLQKNGAGATINIHDTSGDPSETARRAILTMRIH